jgi:DNA-binding MarR family transcriptional regulator
MVECFRRQTEPPMPSAESSLIRILDTVIPRYLQTLRDAISDAEGPDRLTMQQLRCLQAIDASAVTGATTTRLADTMRVSVPTMSSMLDGLTSRSLVERRADPANRRRVPLHITPKGTALLDRYQAIMDDRHRAIVCELSDSEHELLIGAMTILSDRLTSVDRDRNARVVARSPEGQATEPRMVGK